MRLYFLVALFLALVTSVLAWEKEDYEIFDLVSALETAEGKGTTFYSFLDVPPTASTSEISKAYRKLSMQMHPDKNPGVKGAHERFARLGVIASILRNKASRQRYDFFYKNGVPRWRGTGYYYSRFRPGLGSVLVFLIVLTSALQLLVQKMNYKRDLQRIELIMSRARQAAWGPRMVPLNGQRKVRVNLGVQHDEDGFAEGTKFIDMVVDEQHVYILDEDGIMHIVDSSTATPPSIGRTWFINSIKSLLRKVTARNDQSNDGTSGSAYLNLGENQHSDDEGSVTTNSESTSGTSTPKEDKNTTTFNRRVLPVEKAGGKRRKAIRKPTPAKDILGWK